MRGVLPTRGVGDHHQPSSERPQTHQPSRSRVDAVIHTGDAAASEDWFGIGNVHTVLGAMAAVLGVIPCLAHDDVSQRLL